MLRKLHLQLIPLGPRAEELERQPFAVLLSADTDVPLTDLRDEATRRKLLPWYWAAATPTWKVALLRAGTAPNWDALEFVADDAMKRGPECVLSDKTLFDLADGWIQIDEAKSDASKALNRLSHRFVGMWSLPGDAPTRLNLLYAGTLRSSTALAPAIGDQIAVIPSWGDVSADLATFREMMNDDDPFAPTHAIDHATVGGVTTTAEMRPLTLAKPSGHWRFLPVDRLRAEPVGSYWLPLEEVDDRKERLHVACATLEGAVAEKLRLVSATYDRGPRVSALLEGTDGLFDQGDWATRAIEIAIPPDKEVSEAVRSELTETARQILALARRSKGDPDDERIRLVVKGDLPEEFWHASLGIITVARRVGQKAWHTLSAARVLLTQKELEPIQAWGSFREPCVVAVRVAERDGLMEPSIRYDGVSLVADDSFSRKLVDAYPWRAPQSDKVEEPLFGRYQEAVPAIGDQAPPEGAQLPWLTYGDTQYEFHSLLVDHGGGGPSLVAGEGPWEFHRHLVEGLFEPPQGGLKVTYKRARPIGPLRSWFVDDAKIAGETRYVPRVPPGVPDEVEPLCRDFIDADEKAPLALLDKRRGMQEKLRLRIDLPRCPVDVYKRWVTERERLGKALTAYYNALISPTSERRDDEAVALLDPAVSGFEISLSELNPARGEWSAVRGVDAVTVLREEWSADEFLGRGDRLIEVCRSDGAAPSITKPADMTKPIVVTLSTDKATPKVFRLTLRPKLVDKAADRFRRPEDVKSHPCGFYFELPSGALPDASELWSGVTMAEASRVVSMTLAALANRTSPGWLLVSHWAVPKARWRWRGRAVPSARTFAWPDAARRSALLIVDDKDASLKAEEVDARRGWLAEMFPGADTPEIAWQRVHASKPSVLRDDCSKEQRALLTRYGLHVRSRYRGLGDAPEQIARREGASAPQLKTWALPPRVAASLPNVRAVIPLTQRAREDKDLDHRAAAFLVVVRGAAFQQAGFTEALEVRLTEIGRDPLLHEKTKIAPQAPIDPCFIEGPFGHTLDDRSSDNPLFNASSYIVRASKELEPFDFVRVTVSRRADGRFDDAASAGVELALQVLPASDACPPKPAIDVDTDTARVQFPVANLREFAPSLGHASPPEEARRVEPYLLVTRKLNDVRGIPVETFAALTRPTYSPDQNTISFAWDHQAGEVVLRLLLVQSIPGLKATGGKVDPSKWLPKPAAGAITSDAEVHSRVIAVSVPLEQS